MGTTRELFHKLFFDLDGKIEQMNLDRKTEGLRPLLRSK